MRKTLLVLTLVLALPACGWSAEPQVPLVKGWMVTPFILLLLAIALVPFINRGWWDKYYPHVSLGLGFLVLAYYTLYLDYHRMMHVGLDYLSFIALIGSLFVAAGGIFLHTERHATPLMNAALLAVGAVVSNLVGTTGASMLLIRPFVRINKQRIRGFHVVFFIFIVSNIGGALTPIGDPPLFLGYLNGVPFHWTILNVWHIWLLTLALVLVVFFLIDTYAYRRWMETAHHAVRGSRFHLVGAQNFIFLFIILAAVFAASPVRELIMAGAAAAAYRFGRKDALRANEFTFAPIKEVAILFAGIFATMVPALDWLALTPTGWAFVRRASTTGDPDTLELSGQRPHLPEFPQRGPGAAPAHPGRPLPHEDLRRRARALPAGYLGRVGLLRGQHLHRQRAELHGQIDRGTRGGGVPFVFRLHLQVLGPRPHPGVHGRVAPLFR